MATIAPPSSAAARRELTWRALLLGGALTFIFTAANVYFGLRVGLTFSTALPAAVISMALLRHFRDNSLVENNITQTLASAAGAVATMIFVLPGLVMVGWWNDFPYWTTMAVCFVGGTLGVMMSVPLRRALVINSDLPYPEGIAGAEILRVGETSAEGAEENAFGLRTMIFGGVLSIAMSLLVSLQLAAAEVGRNFKVGNGGTGVAVTISMGLLAIGHLIGLSSGIALITGTAISWGVLLPWRTQGATGGIDDVVGTIFSTEVRFIGAGAIAVAAIWTLLKLIKPIATGLAGIAATSRARKQGAALDVTERDLPGSVVGGTVVVALLPIAWLLWRFAEGGPVADAFPMALAATLFFILAIGAVVAAVTGYMAGLIGTSNSPVSGVGILSIIVGALMVAMLFPGQHSAADTQALVAYALFATSFVFGIALIANDNLQDLKTGQLVGSTPWKQQLALVLGVLAGSLVVPPVLNLLHDTMGFAGAPGAGPNALAAPQASLISSLAQGVLGGTARWDLMGLGGAIIAGVIVIDELLGRRAAAKGGKGLRLPPLGVAMGMYLPASLIIPTSIGAFLGHIWDSRAERSRNPEFLKRSGVLLATGIVVGDSLFGLAFAGSVAALGEAPFAVVGDEFAGPAQAIALVAMAALIALGYTRTRSAARRWA